ncbi:hypothetical protein M2171_005714 [Bradyrhizobium japonicum USDA 38]|nr:hypothetical protein [Bradyrhizobium japonicum USDA 38]MCS3949096.1 hypothetical protein [Bradyrhizobium japonicum]MCW2218218.1 hypothetical protein [Bradyrhizobium japonicum]MCW2342831.1 hypothetical protein [Bradyrhizobium japonicum]
MSVVAGAARGGGSARLWPHYRTRGGANLRQERGRFRHQFGIARADAMALRDSRGEAITETDWAGIENRLGGAYRSLKASLSR